MREHQVEKGECLASIAAKYGQDWRKLWDHPDNKQLREKRKEPNVLLAGDVVKIPDADKVKHLCQTNQFHTFTLADQSSLLELQLLDETDQPRSDVSYELYIDGQKTASEVTGADGMVQCKVPPDAKAGRLVLLHGEHKEEYQLDLGHLDPWDEPTGVQQRLNHLGYECGQVDGLVGPATRQALTYFQEDNGLKATGELDEATLRKLEETYGC